MHSRQYNTESLRCQKCGRVFKSKISLWHHEESCRSRIHSCHVCHRDFATAKILRCHHQTHVKSCVCKVCGKSFTNNYSLKNHMRNHTGEHPYLCDKCPLVFKTAAQLRCHRQLLHNAKVQVPEESSLVECEDTPMGVKVKFSCKSCLKVFTSVTAFKIHERYHAKDERLTCKICGRVLGHTGSLKSHMKIHRNERAYVCEFCGKGFIENSELRRHRLIHTGEKPHRCEICGRGFTQSYSLKNHQRTHIAGTANYCQSCKRNFRSTGALQKHKCVPVLVPETLNSDCKNGFSGKFTGSMSSEESSTQEDIQGLETRLIGDQSFDGGSGLDNLPNTSKALCGSMCNSYGLLQNSCAEMKTAAPVSSCSVVTVGQTKFITGADALSEESLDCGSNSTFPKQQGSLTCCSSGKPAKLFMEQAASASSHSPWTAAFTAFNPTPRPASTSSLAPSHSAAPILSTHLAPPPTPVFDPYGSGSLLSQEQTKLESPRQDATPPGTALSSPHPLLQQLLSVLNTTLPEHVVMATTQAMAKTVPGLVRLAVGEAKGGTTSAEGAVDLIDTAFPAVLQALVQSVTKQTLDSVAQQLPPLLTLALKEELTRCNKRQPSPPSQL